MLLHVPSRMQHVYPTESLVCYPEYSPSSEPDPFSSRYQDRLFRRAVQNEVNLAIHELAQVTPPRLTPGAKALLHNDSDYTAWRSLETSGDALQSFLVMDVVMNSIPQASIQEMTYISSVMESNESLNHYASKIDGVDKSLLAWKTGANALEMVVGMLSRDANGGGIAVARDWYHQFFPEVIRRGLEAYRKYKTYRLVSYRYDPQMPQLIKCTSSDELIPVVSRTHISINYSTPAPTRRPLGSITSHNVFASQASLPTKTAHPYRTPSAKAQAIGEGSDALHQRQATLYIDSRLLTSFQNAYWILVCSRKILVTRRDGKRRTPPSTPVPAQASSSGRR
ncbi:hypothetical protein AAF712_002339 [Marasmius tenuissimus]|uniref:RNase III domain-containing protein n=1 Tax=Marasmius tenuissimus TaxID=585030 RepID=A0ABR3AAV9_9AGAR